MDRQQPRRTPLADLVGFFHPLSQFAATPRLYNFFATIS